MTCALLNEHIHTTHYTLHSNHKTYVLEALQYHVTIEKANQPQSDYSNAGLYYQPTQVGNTKEQAVLKQANDIYEKKK